MEKLEIYYLDGSLNALILKLVLREKKIPFVWHCYALCSAQEFKPLDTGRFLKEGEFLVRGSGTESTDFWEILKGSEEIKPSPPLIPESSEGQETNSRWLERFSEMPQRELEIEQTQGLQKYGLLQVYKARLRKLEASLKKYPEHAEDIQHNIQCTRRYLQLLAGKTDDIASNQKVFEFFNALEQSLLGRNFLTGAKPVQADFAIGVFLFSLEAAGLRKMWQGGKFPRVSMYYSRMKTRESVARLIEESRAEKQKLSLAVKGMCVYVSEKMKE